MCCWKTYYMINLEHEKKAFMTNVIIFFLFYWVEFFPSQVSQKVFDCAYTDRKSPDQPNEGGSLLSAYRIIGSVKFLVGPGKKDTSLMKKKKKK